MRVVRDNQICSAFQLCYFGESAAENYNYYPSYSDDGPVAETLEGFKAECKKAAEAYDKGIHDSASSVRCGSVIFATTIEHQPIATKHLLDLGFTGTGWIKFGKYSHKLQFFTMPLPLFIPAIGLEYFYRDDSNDDND